MSIALRILLNLFILIGAAKMDQTGYGVLFAALVLIRYEMGPMLQQKDDT